MQGSTLGLSSMSLKGLWPDWPDILGMSDKLWPLKGIEWDYTRVGILVLQTTLKLIMQAIK